MPSIFPFHSESERDFYAHLGLYASLWSSVEIGLQQVIEFIFKFRHGASVESEQPLNLERRITFLRKASKRLDSLASERAEILGMMDYLKDESAFRHLVIHGRKRNYIGSDPHFSFLTRPLDRKRPHGEQQEMSVTQAELESHYDQLGYLALCMMGCLSRMTDVLEREIAEAGG